VLAYPGLESGAIDATDLYSTDAEIRQYQLRVLQDDLGHFPAYNAVLVYRADLETRAPGAVAALLKLEGLIDDATMAGLNARALIDRQSESAIAANFLAEVLAVRSEVQESSVITRLIQHTKEHLILVVISLGAAILVAVPLGILGAHLPRLGQAVLGVTGIVQTIPSLALLMFMMALLTRLVEGAGFGAPPAIAALFLYSLLPIVRNTFTGLRDIPSQFRESAEALGLPVLVRLRRIELPMASRAILAGIKTAAVINVGFATLGAFIGAGGYGQPILTGLRLADTNLILEGAIPAAVMALLVQALFEFSERILVPLGLRLKPVE
jgi:osmoprotectant transport system permease protein